MRRENDYVLLLQVLNCVTFRHTYLATARRIRKHADVLCFQLFHRQRQIARVEDRAGMAQRQTNTKLAPAYESVPNFCQQRTQIGRFLHECVWLRISHDVVGIVRIADLHCRHGVDQGFPQFVSLAGVHQ